MAWADRLLLLVIHIASYIKTGYNNIIIPSSSVLKIKNFIF